MSRRGMTLLELIVVLVLMAVAVSIAVPALPFGNGDDANDSPMHELSRLVADARRKAITRRTPLTLYIAWPDSYEVVDRSGTVARGRFDSGGSSQAVSQSIRVRVDALGRTYGDTIRIRGRHGDHVAVPHPWTGELRFDRP